MEITTYKTIKVKVEQGKSHDGLTFIAICFTTGYKY
jgi:hypothetical protein